MGRWLSLVGGVVALALFSALAGGVGRAQGLLVGPGHRLIAWVAAHRDADLTHAMLAVTTLGDAAVLVPITAVLGVHWPADVLGGWLLDAGWTLLCIAAGYWISRCEQATFPGTLSCRAQVRKLLT